MSQKSNVNPDHYEGAGRERPGDDVLHEQNKQQLTQHETAHAGGHATENFIPGAAPVGERASGQQDASGQQESEQDDTAAAR